MSARVVGDVGIWHPGRTHLWAVGPAPIVLRFQAFWRGLRSLVLIGPTFLDVSVGYTLLGRDIFEVPALWRDFSTKCAALD